MLALAAVLAAVPARAQGKLGFWPEPPEQLMGAVLQTPYAQALLKTFAASVRKDGDRACLQAKALDDAASIAGGRSLLQRYGVRMMTLIEENFDRAAFEAALATSAGPDAAAEIVSLEGQPDVKAFIAVYRPARLAKVMDTVLEQFDRYVLIRRVKLDPIAPIARGESEDKPSEAMRANPTAAAEEASRRFVDEHPSGQLDRYLDLLDAIETARPKGITMQAAMKLGPVTYFEGVERDLAELCIGRR